LLEHKQKEEKKERKKKRNDDAIYWVGMGEENFSWLSDWTDRIQPITGDLIEEISMIQALDT